MSKPANQNWKEVPWEIVGSTKFGRYPKISREQTFNMIQADDFLVDYAGYKNTISLNPGQTGRGIYSSNRAGKLYAVIGDSIYSIGVYATTMTGQKTYTHSFIGNIQSFSGPVFIAENNTNQIAFCDTHKIYIYNYVAGTFNIPVLPEGFNPGYIAYQDGRFIAPDTKSALWILSALGDGEDWFPGPSGEVQAGEIETKPDLAQAVIPFPGRANLAMVFGNTVAEFWTDYGVQGFPYKKNTNINIDYGCLSAETIAAGDKFIIWLAANEKSGPVIMYSEGGDATPVSFDGLNFRFSELKHPEQSAGFILKLNGKLLYQLTFYNPADNLSLLFDLEAKQFYTLTDELWNYHIARRVAFFEDDYYFVSFNDGNLYLLSAELTSYDYGFFEDDTPKVYEIPRARVCKNIRDQNSNLFVINSGTFTLEQGEDPEAHGVPAYIPRMDLSVSLDGGTNFSSYNTLPFNTSGNRVSRPVFWGMGYTNDFVSQLRFWSFSRLAIANGTLNIYE